MLRFGQAELDEMAKVAFSGKPFRYKAGSQCARFERRFARSLGARFVHLTSSGSTALSAALGGLGVGPGDEVIVPAYTYMATATAVLAVGAIPVIIDIDESLTMDPAALEAAVGPRTRAVIPVHMGGLVCDMDAIMRIARRRKLLVVEDACQCVGGAYKGRPVGAIGHAGAFSFNFYKNMTCGEGGAISTNDESVFQRAQCMVDCCSFYWNGRPKGLKPFVAAGARASEFEGAMLNAQFDRLGGMIRTLRRMKKQVLAATAGLPLKPIPSNSLDWECATQVDYQLPTAGQADKFAKRVKGVIPLNTGRHTYINWDPILQKRGAHHPAMDPFRMAANRGCRMDYRKDLCPRSLDILARTVMIGLHPDRTAAQVDELIAKIRRAIRTVMTSPAANRRRATATA
ncbi:MAG: DegT/DnrJ/EryC1/StrS family aminotransferase [Phycisphaerae bacterium]